MQTVSPTHIKFGQMIKQLRITLSMSQEELAFKVGLDRSYIGFVERGEKNPTLLTMIKLSRALKTPLHKLFK